MKSAASARSEKPRRECSPSERLMAAPGLYASVSRTSSPRNSCGTWAGTRCVSAARLVAQSVNRTRRNSGQKRRAFGVNSMASVRDRPGGAQLHRTHRVHTLRVTGDDAPMVVQLAEVIGEVRHQVDQVLS